MTDKILSEQHGPVTTIVINRPKSKNALDNEAAHGLADALRAFEADPEARVAVLTGAGGAFCAGADLKELGGGTDYFPWAGSADGPLRAPLSKPVIAEASTPSEPTVLSRPAFGGFCMARTRSVESIP